MVLSKQFDNTKKKELVGNFKNNGHEWRPKGRPEAVNVHDFMDPKLKRAVPYGVYDINNNVGWVSVGTDRDTASFAVNTIRRWWRVMGRKRYPKAKRLMIAADGVVATGTVRDYGKSNYSTWLMSSNSRLRFATYHPAQANGTK